MEDLKIIGTEVPRKDALEKLTGIAKYGADVDRPGQLYAALCTSPWAYAKILNVDTSEAKKLEGVRVVLTGKENPGRFGQFIQDQPVLAVGLVRYEGEPVAAVAADSLDIARAAAKLIQVEYEALKPVMNPEDAMRPDAPLIHEEFESYSRIPGVKPLKGTNVVDTFHIRTGDIEKGFADSDLIVEHDYSTKGIAHANIEPHVSIAEFSDGSLTIWTPTQSPYAIRDQLSGLFGLKKYQVRIICTPVGGGFGGKYELRCEPICALLSKHTKGRPVKLVLTRHQEFLLGGIRGPSYSHLKMGVKKDGTLVAYQLTANYDTGAYTTTGPRLMRSSGISAGGPYNCPNVSIDANVVITNKQLTCAYRGFGVPEISWVYESHMDIVAKELGMDPLELRLKNAYQDGDLSNTGEVYFNCNIKQALHEVARILDWDQDFKPGLQPDGKLHGRGIASTAKVTGTPSSSSVVTKFDDDGTVTILQSGMEIGQGHNTTMCMIVAESMGLPLENVKVAQVDTLYTPYEKTTTSSRLTHHTGNACLRACEDMKRQLIFNSAKFWDISEECVCIQDGVVSGILKNGDVISYHLVDIGKTGVMREREPVNGRGAYSTIHIYEELDPQTGRSKRSAAYWFWTAQGCEIEIDPQTCKLKILRFVAVNDAGKVINRLGAMTQIEGSVMMGIGHALMEELIYDSKSLLKNGTMVDFKVPTVKDVNYELEISFIENAHPEGPFGAKGLGEPALTPTAPALGNAIAQAIGDRLYTIPMKSDDIYCVLHANDRDAFCCTLE